MADKFHGILFTDSVRKAQAHYYGKPQRVAGATERDALTEDERVSFNRATVSAWRPSAKPAGPTSNIAVAGPDF